MTGFSPFFSLSQFQKTIFRLIILFAIFGFLGIEAYAQPSADTLAPFFRITPGADGGDVRVLSVDSNNVIFAGVWGRGVYRSYNSGQSWSVLNNGLTNLYVTAIEFDGSNIFVGTFGGGVFKSSNNGLLWIPMNNGITNNNVTSVKLLPKNVIYAGTSGSGVFKSINGGVSWTDITTNLWFRDISTMIIAKDSSLIVGTLGDGIYRIKQNSTSWNRGDAGLLSKDVTSFAINNQGDLLCGTLGGGVMYSVSNGASWVTFNPGSPMNSNVIDPTALLWMDDTSPLVGTKDMGIIWYDSKLYMEWKLSNFRINGINTFLKNKQGTIYAATPDKGIFTTTNQGLNWTYLSLKVDSGIAVILPSKNGYVFSAGKSGGMFVSSDFGASWNKSNLPQATIINAIAVDSSGPVYAAGYNATSGYGLVFKSNDMGTTFSQVHSWSDTIPTAIGISPSGSIYLGVNFPPPDPMAKPPIYTDLLRSINGGVIFTSYGIHVFSDPGFIRIGIDPTGMIFCESKDSIIKSVNNGTTWTSAFKNTGTPKRIFTSMTFDPNGVLYTSSDIGLMRTSDLGTTWTTINYGYAQPNTDQMAITANGTIYSSIYYSMIIIRSIDKGMTWDTVNYWYNFYQPSALAAGNDGFVYLGINSVYRGIEGDAMIVPNLVSPTNTQPGVDPNNAVLTWNTALKADMYDVQISVLTDFSNILEETTLSSHSYKIQYPLSNNTIYNWRVRSRTNNALSDWSSAYTFTTQLDKPILAYPPNDSAGLAVSTQIRWHRVDGAGSYTINVSLSPDFSTLLTNVSNVKDTVYTLNALSLNTKYYWRIQANAFKSYSSWSDVWNFTTKLKAPTLVSPSNGIYGLPTIVTLNWNSVDGAINYEIQIAKDAQFTQMVFDGEAQLSNSHQTKLLEYFNTYYWHIRAKNDYGYSDWSVTWKFITIIEPVLLKFPDNNSVDQKPAVSFEWLPDPAAQYFHVQVSKDQSFGTVFYEDSSMTTDTLNLSNLDYFTTYFWRVRIRVNQYDGIWSDVWQLKTGLGKPLLSMPVNNDTNIAYDGLTIFWLGTSGADYYLMQLATDAAFKNIIYSKDSLYTLQTNIPTLQIGTKYYWRIKGYYADGQSSWSDTWNFTTTLSVGVNDPIAGAFTIGITPNPANSDISVSWYQPAAGNVSMKIIDLKGNSLMEYNLGNYADGSYNYPINISRLTSGKYFLVFTLGNNSLMNELLIVR